MEVQKSLLVGLREMLVDRFDDTELRTLCFDLEVDYDGLSGEGKADKARELIAYLARRERLAELIERGRQARPDIPWEEMSVANRASPSVSQSLPPERRSAEPSGGVHIGNVTGGIRDSVIAGRDVVNATLGGGRAQETEPAPTVDALEHLLAEAGQELAAIVARREALQGISAAAPFTAQGAAQAIEAATVKVRESPRIGAAEVRSIRAALDEAATLLHGILHSAQAASEQTDKEMGSVVSLADLLPRLIEKVDRASHWAAILWLHGEGQTL
jgi:hypothetical protein